jgi:hypothetical protein
MPLTNEAKDILMSHASYPFIQNEEQFTDIDSGGSAACAYGVEIPNNAPPVSISEAIGGSAYDVMTEHIIKALEESRQLFIPNNPPSYPPPMEYYPPLEYHTPYAEEFSCSYGENILEQVKQKEVECNDIVCDTTFRFLDI